MSTQPLPTEAVYNLQPIILEGPDLQIQGIPVPVKQLIVVSNINIVFDINEVMSRKKPFEMAENITPIGFPGMHYGEPVGNSVEVSIRCLFFKKDDTQEGGWGERLAPSQQLQEYSVTFRANNTTFCNALTGEVLGPVNQITEADFQPALYEGEGESQVLVRPAGKYYGIIPMKEGNRFSQIIKEQQVNIYDMLVFFIENNKHRAQP